MHGRTPGKKREGKPRVVNVIQLQVQTHSLGQANGWSENNKKKTLVAEAFEKM